MTPSETVSPVKEDIEPVEETIMDDELNELRKRQTPSKVVKEWKPTSMIREPAPDVPESSIQSLLRATSPQGAKGKMPQFEIAPQGQMLAPIQCPKEKTQRGET
ncbi:hypothetical protein RDI58_024242 [Solanum bulbocastanum]|uniref:Uncharacterized protein n=1 Tax=Solanum bulbocastanum TaxID=147425 RepID=A0AAN8SZM7_SOLBU